MSLPADHLTADEKKQLKKMFDEVDTTKDGKISAKELKAMFEKLGFKPTDAQLKEVMARADTDKSGSIDFNEFCNGMVVLAVKIRIAIFLASLFEAIDTDGNGFIDRKEIKQLLKEAEVKDVSEKDIDALIKRADKSGDGKISFEEFINAFVESQ